MPHLAACNQQQAQAIYASIRSMLPVVSVFFELGRKGTSITEQSLETFHLAACLEVIGPRLPLGAQ
jgi:hypothetical protein